MVNAIDEALRAAITVPTRNFMVFFKKEKKEKKIGCIF
jgi:hypothetical protein